MSNETKIDDGGPAFPDSTFPSKGMSLREWFASNECTYPPQEWIRKTYPNHASITSAYGLPPLLMKEAIAKWRYEMADAMIAARKAKPVAGE